MLKFWEVSKRGPFYVGHSGEYIHSRWHYTLTFYPDGACDIFSFRTYEQQWTCYTDNEDYFYAEEEEPVYYA